MKWQNNVPYPKRLLVMGNQVKEASSDEVRKNTVMFSDMFVCDTVHVYSYQTRRPRRPSMLFDLKVVVTYWIHHVFHLKDYRSLTGKSVVVFVRASGWSLRRVDQVSRYVQLLNS